MVEESQHDQEKTKGQNYSQREETPGNGEPGRVVPQQQHRKDGPEREVFEEIL